MKNLKKIREEKNLSLIELSKLCDVSSGYLGLLERGEKTNPSLVVIHKICKALKVTTDDLIGG